MKMYMRGECHKSFLYYCLRQFVGEPVVISRRLYESMLLAHHANGKN